MRSSWIRLTSAALLLLAGYAVWHRPEARGAADAPAAPASAPATRPAGPVVINAGRGGHSTRDLLRRVDRDVLACKPDLVVLLVGTNDLLNHAKAVPPAEYVKNVEALIGRIRGGGSRVLLLTVPPCYEPFLLSRHPRAFYQPEGPNARVAAANMNLRALADRKKVPLVDIHQLFSAVGAIGESAESLIRNPANSRAADGVHPTPEGYRLMAVAVWQAIRTGHLPHGRVVCFGDSITYGAGAKGAGTAEGQTYPAQLARLLAPAKPQK